MPGDPPAKRRDALSARSLAPVFTLVALVFAVGVVSRFDLAAARIPDLVHGALLGAALPLILVTGYLESRIDHGGPPGSPLWMRMQSRPLKWALTLGFTFLATVVVQTLDWELGPVDPDPPLEWPPATRAAWYAMFSFGMFFANYLATTEVVVPILRVVTWPARLLPTALAVLLLAALGLGLDWLILRALADSASAGALDQLRSLLGDPTAGALATTGVILVPLLLGSLFGRRRD
jgi:hypothetical protein